MTEIQKYEPTLWLKKSLTPEKEVELTKKQTRKQTRKEIELLDQKILDNLCDYFWMNLSKIHNSLHKSFWISLIPVLINYKKIIENDLQSLSSGIIAKIKKSIVIKISNLNSIVEEQISNEIDKYWNTDNLKNQRWIVNSKLIEELSYVNNILLPSAQFLIKYNMWIVDQKILTTYFEINKIHIKLLIWEIEEMLNAEVDNNWDFNEWIFSTQRVLDMWWFLWLFKSKDASFAEKDLLILPTKISFLNDKDKTIEVNAQKKYMIAVATQTAIEWWPAMVWSVFPWLGTVIWGIIWNFLWAWIDVSNTFSSTDVLLDIIQSAWLVDPDYRMEKTWMDQVLAWIWLIPWITLALKWSIIAKYMSKIPSDEILESVKKMIPIIFGWDNI